MPERARRPVTPWRNKVEMMSAYHEMNAGVTSIGRKRDMMGDIRKKELIIAPSAGPMMAIGKASASVFASSG